ncbi:MAG: type II secretion system protein M [Azonexus sp.]|jgi:general secretion pathway protein M|nr:type II secretion system protein M [Azonexus sp.]
MPDFRAMIEPLAAFWNDRNRREQQGLAVAGAVVAFCLVYGLLIDPALTGLSKLEKTLPALRQQAAEVQMLARQAGEQANVPAPPPVTQASLEAALARNGLKAESLSLSGDWVKAEFRGVSFAATVNWLDEMQKTARLTVVEANVEAEDRPDTVNATFSLRRQSHE